MISLGFLLQCLIIYLHPLVIENCQWGFLSANYIKCLIITAATIVKEQDILLRTVKTRLHVLDARLGMIRVSANLLLLNVSTAF